MFSKIVDHLTEGKAYILRNPFVTPDNTPFRPLTSAVKLLFHEHTSMEPLNESAVQIPHHSFQFINETTLLSLANDPTILSGMYQ